MNSDTRALIFSFSDVLFYFVGTTVEPIGQSDAVTYLKDQDGRLKKFPSLFRAKQHFSELGFENGWLVMQSPYDEMIGNEAPQKAELPLLFAELSP
jgi:Family of unknown function (DUF6482)